jgi:hypothetical protein
VVIRAGLAVQFVRSWKKKLPASHAHAKSARLIVGPLRGWWNVRLGTALAAAVLVFVSPPAALALILAGEFCERLLYFRAVVALKMPGPF